MKDQEKLAEMQDKQEIKSYFKAPIKAEGGKPSITEVDYVGADGITYKGLQFEGYASTKDPDRCNDIVLPEAFNDSIKGYMENPVILLQHDHEYPIGSVIEATIDSNGLYVKGIVKVDTENVFQALRTGVIKTMSFGYRVNDYECETKADMNGEMQTYNIIKKIELFEISLVSVPMNPKAQVKNAKELVGLSDDEYKSNFQINKRDEYDLFKSISDAIQTYEKACGGKKPPKKDAEDVIETQEVVEKVVEEEQKEENTGETVTETQETVEETTPETITPETPEKEPEKVDKVEKTEEIVEGKSLDAGKDINDQLRDLIYDKLGLDSENGRNRVYICDIYDNKEFVFNYSKYTESESFDKFYRGKYKSENNVLSLDGDFIEVEAQTQRVDKVTTYKKLMGQETKEIVEEKVDEIKEEPKETIETPKDTSENGGGNVDEAKKPTENVAYEAVIVEKVDNIEKSFAKFEEKSLEVAKEVTETKENVTKSFDEISKSIELLKESKASDEEVKSLAKSVETISKSYESLKQDNEEMVQAMSELTDAYAKMYKALQRITVDGSLQYKEEPKAKSNPILDTKLAKAIESLKG